MGEGMGSIKRLAEEVERGLRAAHPGLRLTVVRKLSPDSPPF